MNETAAPAVAKLIVAGLAVALALTAVFIFNVDLPSAASVGAFAAFAVTALLDYFFQQGTLLSLYRALKISLVVLCSVLILGAGVGTLSLLGSKIPIHSDSLIQAEVDD